MATLLRGVGLHGTDWLHIEISQRKFIVAYAIHNAIN